MIISVDVVKAFTNSIYIYDKNSPESGHRGNITQLNKGIYGKSSANIIFNGENLKAFSLKSEK